MKRAKALVMILVVCCLRWWSRHQFKFIYHTFISTYRFTNFWFYTSETQYISLEILILITVPTIITIYFTYFYELSLFFSVTSSVFVHLSIY